MPAAYSNDLRDRVMHAVADGESVRNVAKRFGVSGAWIRNLKHRRQKIGNYHAVDFHGRVRRKRTLKAHQETLKEIVTKTPDATLNEIAEQLPIKVSTSMVYRELQHLKLTYKKSDVRRRTRPSRRCRTTSRVESDATRFRS